MIAYWYHDGKVGEHEFTSLFLLTAFNSPIPVNAQVYFPKETDRPSPKGGHWAQVNARNRIVPVPIGVCRELRAALLLMGVPVHE